MSSEQRRENYACGITYVTNSELGFDYLRDKLATENEVDSILIDEARAPLIISGPAEKPSEKYYKSAKIVAAFERELHYTVDEKQKTVLLTEQGYEDAEEILSVKYFYDPREQWTSYILNARKAKELFLRVEDGVTDFIRLLRQRKSCQSKMKQLHLHQLVIKTSFCSFQNCVE